MTTLEQQAEQALRYARALEAKVAALGKRVDARDPAVAHAQEIVNNAAEQANSPLGRQMARRELGRNRS